MGNFDTADLQKITWKVNGLGEMDGWLDPSGCTQFFGVPYAEYPQRFRHSTVLSSWKEGRCDATKLRGYCPQPKRFFYPFKSPPRAHAGDMYIDEFDSLNCQITVPPGFGPGSNIPVIVYIHGGAFVLGTGNYNLLDGKNLAQQSVEYGKPMIIVTINYRLGFYGFMVSPDIVADNEAHGEIAGNYGLHDQKNALLWVNKYIANFGGDPGRITVMGHSAGASSLDTHLRTPYSDLFQNAICLSGTSPICSVYSLEETTVLYEKLLLTVGISLDLPPAKRLEQLRAVPEREISEATYIVFQGLDIPQFGLNQDATMLAEGFRIMKPSEYTSNRYAFKGRLMTGDCLHEGIPYGQVYGQMDGKTVIGLIRSHLDDPFATEFIDHYGLKEEMSAEAAFEFIEKLLGECLFSPPPTFIAECNPDTTWRYHWDELSPYDNAWGGYAHHNLDYMFSFGNNTENFNAKHYTLSRAIAADYLAFANGESPYPSYGSEGTARTYGPDGLVGLVDRANSVRPLDWWSRMAPHMDGCMAIGGELSVRRSQLVDRAYGPGGQHHRPIPQLGNRTFPIGR